MCQCLAGVRQMPLKVSWLLFCLIASLLLADAGSVPAADKSIKDVSSDLRKGLAKLAKDIESFLKAEQRENAFIAVGGFTGPTIPPGTGGPEITKTLKEELKKLKLNIAEDAKKRPDLEIRGRYNDVQDKKTEVLAVDVVAQITEGTKTLKEFEHAITGEESVTKLFAPSAQFTPEPPAKKDAGQKKPDESAKVKDAEVKKALADDKTRNQKLKEGLDNPKANIVKTVISASPNSPYKIEILVAPKSGPAKEYVPVPAVNKDGRAFVSIKRDEFYAIRCYNDSPYAAAVKLTIDGLDVFSFKDEPETFPVFIIDPKSTVDVRGWYRTAKVSDSFLVTEYAKSAAAQLHNEANIGAITASFSAAWPNDPPPDEPEDFGRSVNATARGPALQENFTLVNYFIGKVRATVSVRYNKAEEPPADLPPAEAPPKGAPPKEDPAKKAPPPKDTPPKDGPPKKDPPPKDGPPKDAPPN
jgi:hypothetical protein